MTTKKSFFNLLLIVLFSLLIGCRTEIENEISRQNPTNIEEKISFSQFKNETRINNFKSTVSVYSDYSSKTSKQIDFLSIFKIDTANINKLHFKKNLTYSFRAYNLFESPNKKYNVVYFYKNNRWNYSLLELLDNNGIKLIYDSRYGSLKAVDNTSTSRTCVQAISVARYHCTCKSSNCDECGECISYVTQNVTYDCDGGSSNPGERGSDNGGNSGTGDGGGSGGGYADPGGYVFDPNLPASIDAEYVRASRANSFFVQLTSVGYIAQRWASENPDIYKNILENYLDNFQVKNNTQNLIFANWSVSFFLLNPEATWQQFQNWFMDNTTPEILAQIVQQNPTTILNYEEMSPNFKMRKIDQIKYPRFTNTVKDIPNYVNSNNKVMTKFKEFTGLGSQQIIEKLKFGKGPMLEITDLDNAYGYHNPFTDIVKIDTKYVKMLENSSAADAEVLNLLLSITLLHEFIHWTDGVFFNWTQENGEAWELATYGIIVHLGNIHLIKK